MAQVKIQAWDHLPLSAAEQGYPRTPTWVNSFL